MSDMIFDITYSQQVSRVVQAVMIDARNQIGLGGDQGLVIQPAVDAEVASIGVNPYFFIIETGDGSLSGYFVLNDNGTLKKKLLRPSCLQFEAQIDGLISNFITSGDYEFYTLK